MRRILFVDDEPMVLRGLQRGLYSMRSEWDMAFVESGAEGLSAMAAAPFDAVVTDMQMPQMNGAQFLKEVMARHPVTVRLVLSGHADRELILECVGAAHQYLTKPCDVEVLKSAIRRAFQQLGSKELDLAREVLGRVSELPVLPERFRELQRILQDPDVPLASVAAAIQADIGLTARVLKLTNSSFFGLRRTVASVPEAIQFLGTETLKALALLEGFMDQVPRMLPRSLQAEALSEKCLRVAQVARTAAESEAPALADASFAAGLLHKTGLLLLGAAFPQQFQCLLNSLSPGRPRLWEAEREIFGLDHARVGAHLLGLWGLPEPILEGVAHYPCPSETPPCFGPATAVHGACASLVGTPGFESPLWDLAWDEAHLAPLVLRVPAPDWSRIHLAREGP